MYFSTGTHPMSSVENVGGALLEVEYCAYIRNYPLLYTEIGFKAVLLLISCIISVRVRDIPGSLVQSKVLLIIIYNTLLVSIIVLSVTQLTLTDVPLTILIQTTGVCFSVILNCFMVVFPLVFTLYSEGDNNAAERIMAEIFLCSKSSAQKSEEKVEKRKKILSDKKSVSSSGSKNTTSNSKSSKYKLLITSSYLTDQIKEMLKKYISNNNSTKANGKINEILPTKTTKLIKRIYRMNKKKNSVISVTTRIDLMNSNNQGDSPSLVHQNNPQVCIYNLFDFMPPFLFPFFIIFIQLFFHTFSHFF